MKLNQLPHDILYELSKHTDTTSLHRTSRDLRLKESEFIRSSNLERSSRRVYAIGVHKPSICMYTALTAIRDGAYGKLLSMLKCYSAVPSLSAKATHKSIAAMMIAVVFMHHIDFERLYNEFVSMNNTVRWDIVAKWCRSVQGVDSRIREMLIAKSKVYSRLMDGDVDTNESWEKVCDWYDIEVEGVCVNNILNTTISEAIEMVREALVADTYGEFPADVVSGVAKAVEDYNPEIMFGLKCLRYTGANTMSVQSLTLQLLCIYRLPELALNYIRNNTNTIDSVLAFELATITGYYSFIPRMQQLYKDLGVDVIAELKRSITPNRFTPMSTKGIVIRHSTELISSVVSDIISINISFSDIVHMCKTHGRAHTNSKLEEIVNIGNFNTTRIIKEAISEQHHIFSRASSEFSLRVLVMTIQVLKRARAYVEQAVIHLLENVIKHRQAVEVEKVEFFTQEMRKYDGLFWNVVINSVNDFNENNKQVIADRRAAEDKQYAENMRIRSIEDRLNHSGWIDNLRRMVASDNS